MINVDEKNKEIFNQLNKIVEEDDVLKKMIPEITELLKSGKKEWGVLILQTVSDTSLSSYIRNCCHDRKHTAIKYIALNMCASTKNPLTRDQALDDANNDKDNSMEKNHPNVIDIDKAIIVSDLHLGYEKCNATAFTDFLDNCISNGTSKEYSLFILGDLSDLWRKHDIIYSRESDEVLSLINQFKDVYYLPGNHDHITLDAAQNYPDFNCYNISRYFRIKSGEKNFFLVHGHELEVLSKLISIKPSEYDKISDQLCRMNDTEGNIASYLHEMYHKVFTQGQPQISDFLQTAEQRQGMDAIDKFAKSKARYPLLGMQLNDIPIFGHTHRPYIDIENRVANTGAWTADMLVPKWFEEEYGQDKACSGWHVEINNGEYKLVPYGIHPKTKEERKHSESNQEEKRPRRKKTKKKILLARPHHK